MYSDGKFLPWLLKLNKTDIYDRRHIIATTAAYIEKAFRLVSANLAERLTLSSDVDTHLLTDEEPPRPT